ncbi:hypothetical protein C6497_17090 [Candidatus Poribacteria bacterium]|nr:MAG: hypothetical protein C6497_17090 [Candidatus Poribacteria bacterium]
MPQKEEPLQTYLQFLRKYDFLICLSTILVLGIALIIALRLPKTYSASTLMQLIQKQSTSPISSGNLFQTVLSGGVDTREMATISRRFSTESMLNAAIEKLEDSGQEGVHHLPSIGYLKRHIKAQINPEADYIELSIELREAQGGERNAALLVNQLARDMQDMRSEIEKDRLAKHQNFLRRKRQEVEKEITQLIEDSLTFVRENGSPETWYPRLASLLEQHRNLQERHGVSEQNLHAARGRYSHLKAKHTDLEKLTQITATQSNNPLWLYQKEKLIELESQRIGDVEKTGKSSYDLAGLDAQIEKLNTEIDDTEQLSSSTTIGTSPHYTYIENQLIELPPLIKNLENTTKQISKELTDVKNELELLLAQIPENQHVFERLRTKIELSGTLLTEIEKRYLESEIVGAESDNAAFQKGGIQIIDVAVPRKISVSPQFKLILILAGIVGLCFGITLALLFEYFKTPSESLNS